MSEVKGLDVTIMGREFRVACPVEEQAALMDSVEFLDARMREIRDAGKIIGIDRIAIMAALNIVHEYLHANTNGSDLALGQIRRKLKEMQKSVDEALIPPSSLF